MLTCAYQQLVGVGRIRILCCGFLHKSLIFPTFSWIISVLLWRLTTNVLSNAKHRKGTKRLCLMASFCIAALIDHIIQVVWRYFYAVCIKVDKDSERGFLLVAFPRKTNTIALANSTCF